ncbi:MAG: hypothetical protein AMXMBFR75_32410 [Candidatus Hinthialibacteria bacterium]
MRQDATGHGRAREGVIGAATNRYTFSCRIGAIPCPVHGFQNETGPDLVAGDMGLGVR